MKIVIFGLAITSSWGNGHATTFRSLAKALHRRGHQVVFFERNCEWYSSNRDLPHPDFCRVHVFDEWRDTAQLARRELVDAEVALVGSYFPQGIEAGRAMLDANVPVKCFYDIDTPITIAQLRDSGQTAALNEQTIKEFDLYLSFTGGPVLEELVSRFGARSAVPLYCSFDPDQYHPAPRVEKFACDLSYMGTYAPDRQAKIEELLCRPASHLPSRRFLVAGPQFPAEIIWPKNVQRIMHLNPQWHRGFYSSSRLTLNVTRRDMEMAGFSPSVRMFEAAASATAMVSDNWPGLDTFFTPGEEILLPIDHEDVRQYITGYSDEELARIGSSARERVLAEHSNMMRAMELEGHVANVLQGRLQSAAEAVKMGSAGQIC